MTSRQPSQQEKKQTSSPKVGFPFIYSFNEQTSERLNADHKTRYGNNFTHPG